MSVVVTPGSFRKPKSFMQTARFLQAIAQKK
jgi:hypothetical protein